MANMFFSVFMFLMNMLNESYLHVEFGLYIVLALLLLLTWHKLQKKHATTIGMCGVFLNGC